MSFTSLAFGCPYERYLSPVAQRMGGSCSRSNGKFHNSENERSENRNDEKIEIGSDAILDPDADVEFEQGGAGTWTPKAEDFWSTASYDVEENFKFI